MLVAKNQVAQGLFDSGVWNWSRRRKNKNKNVDRYRVNIVDSKLCDDILNYIGPTLERHKGCDLVDIFPGVGVWSQKLHDVLEPRSHLLLEPDGDFYQQFLDPLLQRPGTKLLHQSGIVWEELASVLNPAHLPHQVERRYSADETPERNDTLLVTVNLSMYPKKKFRHYDSLMQLVLFQLMQSIRPGSLFQKYGLVRMLIWVGDEEKNVVVPRSLQRRSKSVIETELATDWVCEVAGADVLDETGFLSTGWFKRDMYIDLESVGKVLARMREQGIVTPPGRETQAMKDFIARNGEAVVAGQQAVHIARSFLAEKDKLEAEFAAGKLGESSAELKRLKMIKYWTKWNDKRGSKLHELHLMRTRAIELFGKDSPTAEELAEAQELNRTLDSTISQMDRTLRAEYLLARDNLQALHRSRPILNWDRRYVEPLIVKQLEFFPNIPCALLDVQPKAAHPMLRAMGPNSTRTGDMFDMILRGLMAHATRPVSKVLEHIYPGAGEGVYPRCGTLRDPRRGGSPLDGWGELSPRCLSEDQLVDILERWIEWPFHPTYSQLVARALDSSHGSEDESMLAGNNVTIDLD